MLFALFYQTWKCKKLEKAFNSPTLLLRFTQDSFYSLQFWSFLDMLCNHGVFGKRKGAYNTASLRETGFSKSYCS